MSATGVGAAVRRKEDFRFITGKGRYTADISRPGQCYIHFVRSPHAHAGIKRIDSTAAAGMPGVLAVLTGTQLAADKIGALICGWMIHSKDGSPMKMAAHPAIADEKACFVGDPVAVVIAETLAQARDAGEELEIDYEVLPAVTNPPRRRARTHRSFAQIAPRNTIYPVAARRWRRGGPGEFKTAKHVTKLDIVNNRLVPNAMETRAAIGEYDSGSGSFTLWNTSQNPHVARLVIAAFVGMAPEHKLRVIAPDVGGGFGSKIFIYPEEVVCLWAAKKVGRPVKWVADRSEAFLADAHGRDHVTHAELALDMDGKIAAMRVKTIANIGAYMSTFSSSVPTYLYGTLLFGPVQHSAHSLRSGCGLYQHRSGRCLPWCSTPGGHLRGRAPDRGCCPRARDLSRPSCGGATSSASSAHQTPGDHELRHRRLSCLAQEGAGHRRRGQLRGAKARIGNGAASCVGFGLSAYIEACGIAPSAGGGLARRRRWFMGIRRGAGRPDRGSIEVLTGEPQPRPGPRNHLRAAGFRTAGAADRERIIVHGDTDKVQFGMGTYGSRSGAVGMSAIVKALDKIEVKAKKVAAHLLEAAEADIVFQDGRFTVAGTDKSAAWGDVALQAYIAHKFSGAELEPGLKEGAFYDPVNFTFPAGCHICEVEIDPETGETRIEKWVAVDDFGVLINPMIVEGQVHGGIAQGVGQALLEGTIYDTNGQLVTGSLMDYTMPRADNLPSFTVNTTMTRCPSNPLGIKGCGEAGAIAAPAAVMNAITDAIGSEDIAMPATAPAVWAAIRGPMPRAGRRNRSRHTIRESGNV